MIDYWNNRGITLLEVLLALGLSSLIVGALLTVYSTSSSAYQKLAACADAQYTARSVVEQIGDDIRGASFIEIGTGGSELRVITPNNNLIRYNTENYQLYRSKTTSLGTAKIPIADGVSGLSFVDNNGLVTVNIEITIDHNSYQLQRSFYSRLIQ